MDKPPFITCTSVISLHESILWSFMTCTFLDSCLYAATVTLGVITGTNIWE